ncbi:dilute class unconventional myosin isoform X6 [Andrena cerasifolii]|uniref:dilute class unconventional myosin isoform X6 n=1 Tax=Andrena cerasifolii TaxID=2819439 RepID=UPI0040381A97
MTTRELYVKGGRVWVPHPEKIWEGAVLLEDYKLNQKSLKVRTDDSNQTKTLDVKSDAELPPLRNPDILIGENNLTSLSFLHEPAVLYNLQIRFQRHCIYTYCGIVLVAFNPYNELPIYGNDTIWAYRGQAMGDLEPHIFAVAEEAYTKLEREGHDQSIIVSGESGAGKTVSAKYTMRYFATVGGSTTETQVEKKVLASLPIMEAIGNAKTTRNDNSSRFGKFIEIQFNKHYHITGASMRTYLLEKSRVVFQANEERNYHIFYQMCAAATRFPHLHLGDQNMFHYLNQGSNPVIDGVDDLVCFDETISALTMLGFTAKQQDDMLRILAAIMHLGNVSIGNADAQNLNSETDTEASYITSSDKHLLTICELLGTDVNATRKWLCHRKIVSMREVFLKPMNVEQAIGARDALAKHIYAELFNWIVAGINNSLQSQNKPQCFIGVLDIYGFETFEINSFEQFCINYANEKLQQQFNQHVFKLEQEEYLKEEIEWTFIDFYDNQPCIDLIETKLGILDLLDEECRMPKGSDSSWAEKLYAKCGRSKHFERPRFGTSAFLIHHFADLVRYETVGFLEKNRDTVIEEQVDVLRNGNNKLLKKLFSEEDPKLLVPSNVRVKVSAQKPVLSSPKQNKKTVGSQFRDSLNMLMATLNATTPHYVRCIKPNDTKEAFEYNPVRAVQQLRACGVLETIRISAAGFPSQRTYGDFFLRYRCLCRFKEIRRDDLKETCRRILGRYIKDEDKFKFGKSKVLFRAGQVAYLEKLRAERQRDACIMIQKTARGLICRTRYRKIRRAVLGLQRHGRGYIARQKAQAMREERAAIKIQARVKGWLKRRRYLQTKRTILGIQKYGRGKMARERYQLMRDNAAAIVIQRFARGYLVRIACQQKLRDIVTVQAAVRRYLAKKVFRRLKAEARSVEHVKSLNKGLEKKIITLQQKITELAKENQSLKNVQNNMFELKHKLEGLKSVEAENKKLHVILLEKEKELEKMVEAVKIERDEKMDILQDKERGTQEKEEENKKLGEELEKLRKELTVANEKLKNNQRGAEENLKHRLEQEKDLLLLDQDQDRGAYQRLLKDYHELEQHAEMMEQKLAMHAPAHSRSLSNASSGSGQIVSTELPQDDQNIVRSSPELQEKYDKIADECRKFKKQCKILAKRLADAGYEGDDTKEHKDRPYISRGAVPDTVESANDSTIMSSSGHSGDNESNMPAIRKKERDYEGMFEFRKEDINVIIRHLIIELKPRVAVTLLPGLPAYILFMCIRHTDCINDDEKVRLLLTGYLNGVKRVVKKREDFDFSVLWFSNTLRLLHSMKQYSGDKPFQIENTPRQNEQCLRNFDLSEYRLVLSSVALWIFNNIMTNLKERIQALTVPALLEHEAISGLNSNKSGRPRSSSMGEEPESTQQKLDKLLDELTSVYKTLQYHGVDAEIVVQLFKQLFYFMCASALNNLLLRNELCHWTKGMQIRYNMSHLEQWGRDRRLEQASEVLQPIIQAAQLLQARKTDEDVNSVCEMCNKLTANQIVKILNLYTPADDFETRVPVTFIKKIQAKLDERGENNEQLLMDLMYSYPIRFPFNPSNIRLEDIDIPEVLHLPMLKKV